MKIVIVFACLVVVAHAAGILKRNDEEYKCPDGSNFGYLSYCAWDPCSAFGDDIHPCSDPPDAVCEYDVCPNANCKWQFFVDKEWVNCTLKPEYLADEDEW